MRALDGPASDLDVLEIDSPELRWLAARDYLAELEAPVTRQINALALIAEFVDRAEANALRRGAIDNLAWGICLVPNDYLTAYADMLKPFQGKARSRADEILKEFIPSNLWEYLC